jgi:hypothetical protein
MHVDGDLNPVAPQADEPTVDEDPPTSSEDLHTQERR